MTNGVRCWLHAPRRRGRDHRRHRLRNLDGNHGSGRRGPWRRKGAGQPDTERRTRACREHIRGWLAPTHDCGVPGGGELEAGVAGVAWVVGAGRFWVGVVCLLPALVVGVKGGGVRMGDRGGEWAVATGWLGSPSVGRLPGSRSRASTPRATPSVHGSARVGQAGAAASGTSVAHPCHNQADPPWTVELVRRVPACRCTGKGS